MEFFKSVYKENFLFWLMFKVFFFIWLLTTVIFIWFCNYYKVYGDGSSIGAYMNLLVFDATIFTPIAAYFFYDSWKEQHNTNIEKEYLKEIFGEFRQYNKYVSKYVEKSSEFIVSENKYKTGKLFRVDNNDLQNFKESYNRLSAILNEYNVLTKDEKVTNYVVDYNNFARNSFAILEGINNLKINFIKNIYGEITETEEEIFNKTKLHLQQFLMKEIEITISGEKRIYQYWLILEKFKATHNNFYTYLLNNKLKA